MKNSHLSIFLLCLLSAFSAFAQSGKVKVTGKLIDQDTKQPLEFANVVIQTTDNNIVNGGLTDAKGEYSLDVPAGTYNIIFDFISFKPVKITERVIAGDTNLGIVTMAPDATVLNEVQITAERSTVEIKLDKRVYSVGQDMMVKGGTVSDVLDNVPSVSVDAEGNVALRGNQSVTILIDGRPSNLLGSNLAEVLRVLPADSVDKVEVITNPSARYDAEGGGGIVNIILKKGKAGGFNGSIVANTGTPENHGVTANLNFRSEQFNFFSNIGYNYRNNPGNSKNETEYLNTDNSTQSYTDERRTNDRLRKGFNASFGLEYFIAKNTTWTNSVNFRRSKGNNPTDTYFNNYDANRSFVSSSHRANYEISDDNNVNFATSVLHKFNDDGHELKVDASTSMSRDDESATINQIATAGSGLESHERTTNNEDEKRSLLQADYVLPIGENSRFEAGYRGSFTTLETDARAEILNNGVWENNGNYTNLLQYKEKVNALYSQFGSKIGNFSYLLGLRWEDSNIDVNLLNLDQYNNKRYNNFFPSAFLTYSFNDQTNISLSYSRRINRPRGRFLNPFSGLESNINIFRGNPDLDPSMTNAFDVGFLKKWNKVTLSTSAYLNITNDPFQFVRRPTGEFVTTVVDGIDTIDPITGEVTPVGGADTRTPVLLTTPLNIGKEYRFGFEFNINYNPFRWWRINSNFNLYRNQTDGDFSYTIDNGAGIPETFIQNYDRTAYSWTTRINNKLTLPGKIDWQLNGNYEAPQNTAQGRRVGVASANTALSKDILKDKGTISLNVQDIFNSRKMKNETFIDGVSRSYGEMQWRERQITLSFTYRFNMSKNEKPKQAGPQDNGGEEYMGGD